MTSQGQLPQLSSAWVCYGLTTLKTAVLVTSIHWLVSGAVPSAIVGMTALALTIILPTVPALRSIGFEAWLTASLACHVVIGMNFDLYGALPFYDKVAHVVVTAGLVIWGITVLGQYCVERRINLPRAIYCCIALMFALSAGAAWEIFEFLVDQTGSFHAQRGLDDTMLDLIADLIGGGLALALMTRSAPFGAVESTAGNHPGLFPTFSGHDSR